MSEQATKRTRGRLLVADDEPAQREMLASILGRAGFEVETAPNGKEALALLEARAFDLLLTDQKMPVMDGLELLDRARRSAPGLPIVLMTAYGTVSTAVEAMKRGATNYLTKPFERDELLLVIDQVLRQHRLEAEVASLHDVLKERYSLENIIGASPPMQQLYSLIERVAAADVSVLITGESGTGKELVARAVHQRSSRVDGPFVGLNCAAVPETLMESEFFGHERGAFTGATQAHAGRFEQADGGTLFLDEIGAMRFELQAKLLRVIQEGEVQRLGSSAPRRVNVRIVAASCEDLQERIRERAFREDLYYRLNVVPIHMPPLRERLEDVSLLVQHFLQRAASKFGREGLSMAPEVLDRLQENRWPGNVRELENCIERMVVLSAGSRLTVEDLPPQIAGSYGVDDVSGAPPVTAELDAADPFELPADGVNLGDLERHLIRQALIRSRGSLGHAARLLGISYKTLQYRVRKYSLDPESFSDAPSGPSGPQAPGADLP